MTDTEMEQVATIVNRIAACCAGEKYPDIAIALTVVCTSLLKEWPYDKIGLLNCMIKDLKGAVLTQAV